MAKKKNETAKESGKALGTRGSGDGAGAANSEAEGRRISQGEFTSPVVMKSGSPVRPSEAVSLGQSNNHFF